MQKIKAFLSSLPKWQLLLFSGGVILLIALIVIVTPLLRRSAIINLGSTAGISVTADKQDSLGVFSDSRFTLKSDEDLSVKAIKDNIKLEPEIEIEVVEVSPRQYQIIPKEQLAPNEIIKIKLSTGEREYSWAFQTKNNFRVVRTLPRDKTTSVPVNSGIEITFSHENFESIDKFFTISPNIEGRFERHQRIVSFVPKKLDPGTLYTVTIKKGITLEGSGDTLTDDTVFQFETATDVSYDQNRINFVRLGYEFSSQETPAIDLYANNINNLSTVKVSVYKYPTINRFSEDYQNKLSIPRWANNYYDKFQISSEGLAKTIEFDAPVQKANYSGYFLFPQTLPKGSYLVEVVNGSQKTQTLVQISDLSAYFTVTGNKTMAWVNRVDTNSPVMSAKVSVLGQDYTTDKDGVAIFTSPASLVENTSRLITINDSQESLLIPAADRNSYYSYGDYQSTRRVSDKYWSYLYLDRPMYQPSDKVRFWGLLRDRDDLNKTQKISIVLSQSNYQDYNISETNIYEQEYQTSNIGTFIGELTLPRLNPGWYTLSVKVGDKNIVSSGLSVETYSKPAYQISLNSSKNAIIAGDTIELSGKTAFFEGTPVSNLKLKVFGQSESEVTTNNQGLFGLSINTSSNSDGEYYQPQYRNFYVNPVQSEEGDINAGTSVAIFNSSIYLRGKSENKNGTAKITVNLNQVDLAKFEPYQYGDEASFIGAPVGDHQIQGELIENTWQKNEVGTYYDFINKTTSPKYQYTQVKKSLGAFSFNTDSNGQGFYEFPTEKDKYYELVFKTQDEQNRVANKTVFIYGTDLYSSSADTRLILADDKSDPSKNYLLDEPVSLTPMQGTNPVTSGKMLYLFAQRGIKSYSITDTGKQNFIFKEAFVPNIYIQGVRFTGKTYQQSEMKMLAFDFSSKKINLDIKLDKPFYQPGDKAHLTVSAKDTKGNPLSSEVNLNLVDEAIFQMSPVTTDPLSQIYKNIDSDIVSFYLSHQYPIETNMAEGGGCFLPGTKIMLANGKTKNIEEIKTGDLIKTRTSPSNQILVNAKVSQVISHQVGEYLLINQHLRVTPEHNLYINGRWMTASDIKVGDSYLDSTNHYQTITSIETYKGNNTVFNLSIDKYHTFFADGFFVHNEKGRDLFVDTAFFGNVQTGSNGEASIDITLPDNLTSWRITGQSITQDLKSGVKTEKLPVKLPFFLDVILGKDYLVSDKPVLSVRGFGEQLTSSDTVNYHVSIPTLNFEKDLSAKAYETTGVTFPDLTIGSHDVIVSAKSGSLTDKITKKIKVLSSRVEFNKSDYQNLTPDTKVSGSPTGMTELIFSDQSSGKYLSVLSNLNYSSGDRIDQKLSRVISKELIKKYFDSSIEEESFTPSVYLMADGGFALFPYASSDPAISAEVACIAGNKVDKSGLVNYLYKTFSEAKETLTASQSLAGLACLDEPVLLLVEKFFTLKDLDAESKIYLSLAQSKLGDTEKSINTVNSIIQNYGQNQDNIAFVKIGKTKDDYLANTSLLAGVAAINDTPIADQLFNYVTSNSSQDILLNDNVLLYVSEKLSKSSPSSVSFAYILNGKKTNKNLKDGELHKIIVSKDELPNIKFEDINGSVGVTSIYSSPGIASQASKDLSINRSFASSGKTSTEFVSTDLIKITLNYSIKSDSQDGCYQVNDYLPSGLRAVTRLANRTFASEDISYPYAIDGQKVSFCVSKNSTNPIIYYARVISPGLFKAESALMQSMYSPSLFARSNESSVNIK